MATTSPVMDKQPSLPMIHRQHTVAMAYKTVKTRLSLFLYLAKSARISASSNSISLSSNKHRNKRYHTDQISSPLATTMLDRISEEGMERSSCNSDVRSSDRRSIRSTSPPSSPPKFKSDRGYGGLTCLPENPRSAPLSPGGTSFVRIGSSGGSSSGRPSSEHVGKRGSSSSSSEKGDGNGKTRASPPRPLTLRGRQSHRNLGKETDLSPRSNSPPLCRHTTIGSFSDTVRPLHDIYSKTRLPVPEPGREHQDPRTAPRPGASGGRVGGQMLGRYSRGEAYKGEDAARAVGWKKEEIHERRIEERTERYHQERWADYLREKEGKEEGKARSDSKTKRRSKVMEKIDDKCTVS